MQLFKEENFKVIVNTELRAIPEFKRLITRDKDRNKRQALKEFSYIYFVYDYKSPYSIYSEDERKVRVRKDLNFDEGWMADKDVQAATKKYVSFLDSPTIKTLTAIREGLLSAAKVINALRLRIDEALLQDDEEEPTDIGAIVKSVTQLIDLSEKLPKAIDTISDLEEKVKKEQSNDSRIKGGGTKGMFEE